MITDRYQMAKLDPALSDVPATCVTARRLLTVPFCEEIFNVLLKRCPERKNFFKFYFPLTRPSSGGIAAGPAGISPVLPPG